MWHTRQVIGIACATVLLSAASARAQDTGEVEIVFDASHSMRAVHEGVPRIAAAKQALTTVARQMAPGARVGLRVFGSRPLGPDARTSCTDSQLLLPIGPVHPQALIDRIYPIGAYGQTPLGYSVQLALQDFSTDPNVPKTIILISDGEESCDVDPVQVVRDSQARQVRVVMHTIGYGVEPAARAQLQQIAELTGGRYADARDAATLGTALVTVMELTPGVRLPGHALVRDIAHLPGPKTLAPATDTFDADDGGWRVEGDASNTSHIKRGRPDYHREGGNPGGYISATDDASGATWYWKAPARYRGDKSAYYGGTLSLDLKQSSTKEQGDNVDLVMQGRGMSLVYDWEHNPGTDWTHYTVTLDESARWYVNTLEGRRATRADVERVLREVEHLLICGEYETGVDTGGLDNVALTPPASSTP